MKTVCSEKFGQTGIVGTCQKVIATCGIAAGVLAAIVLADESSAASDAPAPPKGYYDDSERGWHWYEPEPVEPEPVEERAPEPASPPPPLLPVEVPEQAKAPAPAAPAGPVPFSSAWLRDKLPEFRDAAVDDPTPDNLRRYMYTQRVAMDMSERFAKQWQRVVMSDPVLDENSRRPLSSVGAAAFDRRARDATDALVEKIAGMAGIWYFYRTDCPFCARQSPIIANLANKLDLAILPISLDGKPMEDEAFKNYVANNGQAQELGVRFTPTLYMVSPSGEFVLLSENLVSEVALKERMVFGAHEAGWISDDEFNATRPVNQIQIAGELGDLAADVLNDPVKLVEALRANITGQRNWQ